MNGRDVKPENVTASRELVERPCEDCGEPTYNERYCRDCDQERIVAHSTCRACLKWIWAEEFGGPIPAQHAPGCALAAAEDYGPRDEAELRAVREGRSEGG